MSFDFGKKLMGRFEMNTFEELAAMTPEKLLQIEKEAREALARQYQKIAHIMWLQQEAEKWKR